jgi:hypothetical protein
MSEKVPFGKKVALGVGAGFAGAALGVGTTLGVGAATEEAPKYEPAGLSIEAEQKGDIDPIASQIEKQENAKLVHEREKQVNELVKDVINQTITTLQEKIANGGAEIQEDGGSLYLGNKIQAIDGDIGAEARVVYDYETGRLTVLGTRVLETGFDTYDIVLQLPTATEGETRKLPDIQRLIDEDDYDLSNVSGLNGYGETFFIVGSSGGEESMSLTYGNGGFSDLTYTKGDIPSAAHVPKNMPTIGLTSADFSQSLAVVETRLRGVVGSINDVIKDSYNTPLV